MVNPDLSENKHSTVRSYMNYGIINMDYIKSGDNLADPLTKALVRDRVWNTSREMGLKPIEYSRSHV